MRMFKILSIVISLIFLQMGCIYKKIDSLSRFQLIGKTIDEESKKSVAKVSIFFVDKGFDEHRKKSGDPFKICESGEDGGVNCYYEYFWGRTEGVLVEKPTKTFMIIVKKDNYIIKEFSFDANELRRINNDYQVNLGDIFLSSSTTDKSGLNEK